MTAISMKQLTGRHVLFALLGFFGVMLLANGIFLYFALSTFNGLQNPNAYQEGVNYNARIEAARRQDALGWSHSLTLANSGRVEVMIKDGSGGAVSGLSINGTIARPASDRFTHELAFSEAGLGLYRATVENIEPGNWIVSLQAAKTGASEDPVYRLKERLWLKPN